MKTEKGIERSYDLKYKIYEDVVVNDYENVCPDKIIENVSICEAILIGNHIEQKEKWIDLNNDFKINDKFIIGVFTEVKKGDYVDWVPEIFGVKINEWATWEASLNAGLVSYYRLDGTTGDVIDELGLYNGTNNGATRNIAGKINKSFDFELDDADDVDLGHATNLEMTGDMSVSGWFKAESMTSIGHPLISNHRYSNFGWALGVYDKKPTFFGYAEPGINTMNAIGEADLNTLTWYHLVGRINASHISVWVNGVENASVATGGNYFDSSTDKTYIGDTTVHGGWDNFDGLIDEIGVWNRSITDAEISDLYNSGDGMTYEYFPPTITLNYPAIDEQFSTNSITFNCSVSDKIGVTNVSLYLDGVINETNSSGLNNTDYLFSKTLDTGEHNWTCEGTNNNNETTTADYRDFNITIIAPTVTLNSPIDYYNSTSPSVTFNCSASDDINLVNVSLLIDGVVNETNSSGLNNTAYIWTKSFTDEDYNWTCSAVDNDSATTTQGVRHFTVNTTPFIEFVSPTYDNETNLTTTTIPAYVNLTETYFENLTINLYNSDGLNQSVTFTNATRDYNFTSCLCDDWYLNATTCTTTGQCNSTETRHYLIDVTEPIINITYPTETINYHVINTNLDLNWTAIDTHLDSCWYNYNETNTTVTCGDNTTTINITDYSIRNVTLYANDTFGNENSVTRSWDYSVFENSRTFSNSSFVTSTEQFKLNTTTDGTETPIVYLIFNGTSYLTTLTDGEYIKSLTMFVAEIFQFIGVFIMGRK